MPYTPPDKVRGQMREEDMRKLAERRAAMQYDPAIQELPRQHERAQRHGVEAMSARGLAGTGVGTREAMLPAQREHQGAMEDLQRERGQYVDTTFDELRMQERDRTDQLLKDHFNRWMQKQQLGLQQAQLADQRAARAQQQQMAEQEAMAEMMEVDDEEYMRNLMREIQEAAYQDVPYSELRKNLQQREPDFRARGIDRRELEDFAQRTYEQRLQEPAVRQERGYIPLEQRIQEGTFGPTMHQYRTVEDPQAYSELFKDYLRFREQKEQGGEGDTEEADPFED